jgi:hypothetical protein
VVTALGGAVGGIAFQAGVGKGRFVGIAGFWLIGFGILGLSIGLAQSLILRQHLHYPGGWIRVAAQWALASLAGCFLGGMASSILTVSLVLLLMAGLNVDYTWMYRHGGLVLWTSSILLTATIVGVLQYLILRRRFDSSRKWIWISIIGWCAGLAVAWGVAQIMPGGDVVKGVVGGAVGGIVLGVITGSALVRFLTVARISANP